MTGLATIGYETKGAVVLFALCGSCCCCAMDTEGAVITGAMDTVAMDTGVPTRIYFFYIVHFDSPQYFRMLLKSKY